MGTIRRVFFWVVLVLGVLLILATLLSLIYDVRFWYLKILDFPRVQVLIGLLFCLISYSVLNKDWKFPSVSFVLGLVASIALQLSFVLPYLSISDEAVETVSLTTSEEKSRSFSLIIANVWLKNKQTEPLLDIVQNLNPDMVLVMETNNWWIEQLRPLRQQYPYRVLRPLDNTYGMALYSKLPLNNTQIKFLSHKNVPSIHTEVKLTDGSSFVLHAVHPVPPKPSKHPDNVGQKEVALLKVGKTVAKSQMPAVVAGDFNDVAWSSTSRLFGVESSLSDVRVGRGLYNSFDASSLFLRWPLDHVYVSKEFKVVKLERLPKFGSDHFPIFIKLALDN